MLSCFFSKQHTTDFPLTCQSKPPACCTWSDVTFCSLFPFVPFVQLWSVFIFPPVTCLATVPLSLSAVTSVFSQSLKGTCCLSNIVLSLLANFILVYFQVMFWAGHDDSSKTFSELSQHLFPVGLCFSSEGGR